MQKLKRDLKKEARRFRNRNKPQRHRRILLALLVGFLALAFFLGHRPLLEKYYFNRGERAFAAGEHQRAVDSYLRARQHHPAGEQAAVALLLAADIENLKLQQFREALRLYLLVIRDYPERPEVLPALRQAATLSQEKLGEPLEALMLWQMLLTRSISDGDEVQRQIADCYFRLENYTQARIEFESLLLNYPESPLRDSAQYRIGELHAILGDEAKAYEAMLKVREQWPASRYAVEAGFSMAKMLERQGRLLEAEQLLLELKDKAGSAVVEQRLRQVRARMKEKKKAI